MSGELELGISLNKLHIPVSSTQQLVYVLVEARPTQVIAQKRMPLNFGFVLDHSGSMRGAKIDRLKEAMLMAVSKMAPEDLVSVTIFNDAAKVVASNSPLQRQSALNNTIRELRAGGGTQMSRGLSLGLRQVYRQWDETRSNQVLLMTDGQTYGDEAQCLRLAKEAGEHRIQIQALGLGEQWNENLLDEIGRLSGGSSDMVSTADDIVPFFTQTVERSQKAVMRNAYMTLRLVSGVVPRQVWQVTPVISNLGYTPLGEHDVQVQLGDLDAEDGKSVLIELLLPARPEGRYRVAQGEITYDAPLQQRTGESVRNDIVIEYTGNPALTSQYDSRIMNIVEKVTVYRLQTRALEEAKLGNVAGATMKLRAAATRLLELGEDDLAQAASQEADNLEQSGQMSQGGTKRLRYETRKLTQKLVDLPLEDE